MTGAKTDTLAAEFALGTLDAEARAEAEQASERDADLRELIESWELRLAPLAEHVPATLPSDSVWSAVEAALGEPPGEVPGTLTVQTHEGVWMQRSEGVEKKLLSAEHEGGVQSYMLRLAPGATLPDHGHIRVEECVVLEGKFLVGSRLLGPGDYHLARPGARHRDISTPTGGVLFVRAAVAA